MTGERSINTPILQIGTSRFLQAHADELRPRFRTISLLTLCCHFPSHIFKSLYRAPRFLTVFATTERFEYAETRLKTVS